MVESYSLSAGLAGRRADSCFPPTASPTLLRQAAKDARRVYGVPVYAHEIVQALRGQDSRVVSSQLAHCRAAHEVAANKQRERVLAKLPRKEYRRLADTAVHASVCFAVPVSVAGILEALRKQRGKDVLKNPRALKRTSNTQLLNAARQAAWSRFNEVETFKSELSSHGSLAQEIYGNLAQHGYVFA